MAKEWATMEHKDAKRGLAVIFTIFLISAGISLAFAVIGHPFKDRWYEPKSRFAFLGAGKGDD